MNAPVAYTPAWAIVTYLGLREAERLDKKSYEDRSKERHDKMDLLETFLLGEMATRGEEQIKTEVGTAYKSPQMRVTMTDRPALIRSLAYDIVDMIAKCGPSSPELLALAMTPALEIFTNHVNKDRVKTLLEQNIPPVGIDVHRFTACNVRKA